MAKAKIEVIKEIVHVLCKSNGFDRILDKVKVMSGGNGNVICEMQVDESHTNRAGMLHGGMTAMLVDSVSTMALMTTDRGMPGVSVDMSIMYLNAAKIGDDIVIDANTLKVGKKLAYLTVDIKSKTNGKLLAQGKHTKFFSD